MGNLAKTYTSRRRNFRLSPLELMIVALIALGVLYLITLWIGSLSGGGGASDQGRALGSPELKQALLAGEKMAVRLDEMDKTIAGLKNKLSSATTSGDAKLEQRLAKLEAMVNGLAKGKKVIPVADKKLSRRITTLENKQKELSRLEGRLGSLEQSQKNRAKLETKIAALEKGQKALTPLEDRLASLEQTQKNLAKLEPKLSALENAPKANPALASKMESLEASVKRLSQSLQIAATRQDAIASRLGRMESARQKGQTSASGRVVQVTELNPELQHRLEGLEKRLAKLDEMQDQEKRLAALGNQVQALEKRLGVLAKAKRPPAAVAPPKAALTKTAPSPKKTSAIEKARAAASQRSQTPKKKVLHKVRRGQTLYSIARRYKVTVNQIRSWNPKLSKRRYLWVDEKLVIYP